MHTNWPRCWRRWRPAPDRGERKAPGKFAISRSRTGLGKGRFSTGKRARHFFPGCEIATDADARAISEALAAGRPVDPAALRRIRERSDAARRDTQTRLGVQDIG